MVGFPHIPDTMSAGGQSREPTTAWAASEANATRDQAATAAGRTRSHRIVCMLFKWLVFG